jgi:ribose 5-phosphate isomerase B
MQNKIVALGSDHGGYAHKEAIKRLLGSKGFSVKDFGTNSEESVDYPEFAEKVCRFVAKEKTFGILICGTGIGMSIAANKIKGIRAALCWSEATARLAREHNNANICCIGGRTTDKDTALKIVETFLSTPFSRGERHKKRIEKIGALEH